VVLSELYHAGGEGGSGVRPDRLALSSTTVSPDQKAGGVMALADEIARLILVWLVTLSVVFGAANVHYRMSKRKEESENDN